MKPIVFNFVHFLGVGVVFHLFSWLLPLCSLVGDILVWFIIAYYTLPLARKYVDKNVSTGDKSVLITGCDSGFGNALAKRLDSKGFQVFASCLLPTGEGAEDLKRTSSSRLHVFGMDVRNDQSVNDALKYVKENLGRTELWAVVNNAGILDGFDIEWSSMESFGKSLEVNTLGVVRVTKAFLPLIQNAKGRIVTVTSLAGRITFPHFAAYTMSKFAATAFCECLRQEMQPWGVKVITIEPELFRTPITDPKRVMELCDQCASSADDDVKSRYGEKYFQIFKRGIPFYTKLSTSRIYKVIDCLQDAVSLEEPRTTYKPCRNTATRIAMTVIENMPKPVLDFFVRSGHYLVGFPMPKEANTL